MSPGDSQSFEQLQGVLVEAIGPLAQGRHLLRESGVKGFCDLFRLADAAALYHHVVELVELGEVDQLLQKIASECAADAAILQSNDLFFRLCESVALFYQGGVDIDTAEEGELVSNQM